MSTHYVAMVYHVVGKDMCEGHGIEASERKSDIAATMADEFDLSEAQEELLLHDESCVLARRDRPTALKLAIAECQCALFVCDTRGLDDCAMTKEDDEEEEPV